MDYVGISALVAACTSAAVALGGIAVAVIHALKCQRTLGEIKEKVQKVEEAVTQIVPPVGPTP